MSYPRINLKGINPSDFDFARPKQRNTRKEFAVDTDNTDTSAAQKTEEVPGKQKLTIPTGKKPKINSKQAKGTKISLRKSSKNKYIAVLSLFTIFTGAMILNLSQNVPEVASPIKHNLRKMIRMSCASESVGTYCTSKFKGEDYVVSVNGCKNVYEFNGIPFTDVYTDAQGNYRIPTSNDLTLIIKEPCDSIAATVDSDKVSFDSYASHAQQEGSIERLVWITYNCYTDFTVKIDEIIVFDKTPSTMIEQKHLQNKTAYIYEPEVENVNGAISISGRGCIHPIFIYVKRKS